MASSLIEGLHFKAVLPLAWVSPHQAASFEGARYLAVLAEFEAVSDDHHREQAELHAKLDLALLWLARSLCPELPAMHACWIGLDAMAWHAKMPLEIGSTGSLALNLSDALPFLLHLPAKVQICEPLGEMWHIRVALNFADDNLRDCWERTVFRRHRRAIQLERGESK